MKNVNFAEQKVLYQSTFGLADKNPSRYTIVQTNPESEECSGLLEETDAGSVAHFKNFSEALKDLTRLIYSGHHAGHKGPSYEPLPTGRDGTGK